MQYHMQRLHVFRGVFSSDRVKEMAREVGHYCCIFAPLAAVTYSFKGNGAY